MKQSITYMTCDACGRQSLYHDVSATERPWRQLSIQQAGTCFHQEPIGSKDVCFECFQKIRAVFVAEACVECGAPCTEQNLPDEITADGDTFDLDDFMEPLCGRCCDQRIKNSKRMSDTPLTNWPASENSGMVKP